MKGSSVNCAESCEQNVEINENTRISAWYTIVYQ